MMTFKQCRRLLLLAGFCILIGGGCSSQSTKNRHDRRATQYFEKERYQEALIEYMNVLRIDPNDAAAFRRAGICHLKLGNAREAFRFLRKAQQMDPSDSATQLMIGQVYALGRQFTEARKQAAAILEREPANFEALLLLVDTSWEPAEMDDGLRRLEALAPTAANDARFHLARGNIYLRKNNPETAEAAYRRAAETDPKDSRPHLSLAEMYRSRGDLERADQEYQAAVALAPVASRSRLAWAVFKLETGKPDEAKRILAEITDENPESLLAWFQVARVAFAQKRYGDCRVTLKRILDKAPSDLNALLLRARTYLAEGETEKAIKDYESLVARHPRIADLRYRLGIARLKAKDIGQARRELEKALELNPQFVQATMLLAELSIRTGQAAAAIRSLEALTARYPDIPRAILLLGAAYRAQGRHEEAVATHRRLLVMEPENAKLHYLVAAALREQGKTEEAAKEFASALGLDPKFVLPLAQLVVMDVANQDADAALKRVTDQIALEPDVAALQYLLGKVYVVRQAHELAKAALREAIRMEPRLLGAYILLGQVYASKGEDDAALKKIEEALDVNPRDLASLMLAGMLHQKQGNTTRAIEFYEKALALSPNFAPAANNLAYLYLVHLGDKDKAFRLAQTARERVPDDPYIADTLGWVLLHRGDYKWAESLLRESAEQLPEQPEVLYHLGIAQYKLGKEVAARETLRRALAESRDFTGADEAAKLAELLDIDPATANPDQALARLREILAKEPGNVAALVRSGEISERSGNTEDARKAYESALEQNPKFFPAALKLARLYSETLNDHEKALQYARKARNLVPEDSRAIRALGLIAFDVGDYRWASGLLMEAAEKLPDDARILYRIGECWYLLGQVPQATTYMRKAVESGSAFPELAKARQFLELVESPDPRTALANAKKVLADEPDNIPALMVAAADHRKEGALDRASEIYERILSRHSDFAPASARLAAIYLARNTKLDEAFTLAMKARDTLPDDGSVAATLGKIVYKRGDHEWAVRLLNQGLQTAPEDPELLLVLGLSQHQLGNRDAAERALHHALELDPKAPQAEKARRILAETR